MIKDIVANLSVREGPDVAMDFAVSVAVAFNARLAGIAFVYEPIIPVMIDMYGIPPDVIELQRVESERAAKAAVARLDKAGRDAGVATEAHMLDFGRVDGARGLCQPCAQVRPVDRGAGGTGSGGA